MNILIIYAHPSKKSYTFQILQQLKNQLASTRWSVEISDLYEIGFESDVTENEYETQGLINNPISPHVVNEHKKIEKADCVIFLYPVWWSDCPAKLKGWFDRVYSIRYVQSQTLKPIKHGIVICTAGHSNELLSATGISQSMQNIMLDDRLGKRFQNKEMLILGGTLQLDDVRESHAATIKEVIAKLIRLLPQ